MSIAPAWVDMCRPSATSANEPNRLPPMISTSIIVPHSAMTAQVRRSFCSCPGPRNTWLCAIGVGVPWAGFMDALPYRLEVFGDPLKFPDQVSDLPGHGLGGLLHAVV